MICSSIEIDSCVPQGLLSFVEFVGGSSCMSWLGAWLNIPLDAKADPSEL
jgi:hypothetical protein